MPASQLLRALDGDSRRPPRASGVCRRPARGKWAGTMLCGGWPRPIKYAPQFLLSPPKKIIYFLKKFVDPASSIGVFSTSDHKLDTHELLKLSDLSLTVLWPVFANVSLSTCTNIYSWAPKHLFSSHKGPTPIPTGDNPIPPPPSRRASRRNDVAIRNEDDTRTSPVSASFTRCGTAETRRALQRRCAPWVHYVKTSNRSRNIYNGPLTLVTCTHICNGCCLASVTDKRASLTPGLGSATPVTNVDFWLRSSWTPVTWILCNGR
jgi:hypothetical protein